MSKQFGPSRRAMLKVGLAGAATVASPAILRLTAEAQSGPIKIGMPLALTGALGSVGQQLKRGAELYAKLQNAKGGIAGRRIELLIEDTAGNPATCVRKAQEMVERQNCRLFTGITLSSEALAVVPKLAEWDSIFISSDNGDGRLTAESLVPNFFRANISGPMGTRAVSLYLRGAKLQKFYALGLDYAWGHNSVQVFEQEALKSKKEFLGKIFAPTGTKDYSPYITKIRQSGADAVFLVLQGDDNNAFLSQAQQYRLPEKVKLLTEIVDLASIRAVGDATVAAPARPTLSSARRDGRNVPDMCFSFPGSCGLPPACCSFLLEAKRYSAASACAFGASTILVLKLAGDTISSTSKSSEQAISRCGMPGT